MHAPYMFHAHHARTRQILHAPCTVRTHALYMHCTYQVLFYFARFSGIFEPDAHLPRRALHRDRARCEV